MTQTGGRKRQLLNSNSMSRKKIPIAFRDFESSQCVLVGWKVGLGMDHRADPGGEAGGRLRPVTGEGNLQKPELKPKRSL